MHQRRTIPALTALLLFEDVCLKLLSGKLLRKKTSALTYSYYCIPANAKKVKIIQCAYLSCKQKKKKAKNNVLHTIQAKLSIFPESEVQSSQRKSSSPILVCFDFKALCLSEDVKVLELNQNLQKCDILKKKRQFTQSLWAQQVWYSSQISAAHQPHGIWAQMSLTLWQYRRCSSQEDIC